MGKKNMTLAKIKISVILFLFLILFTKISLAQSVVYLPIILKDWRPPTLKGILLPVAYGDYCLQDATSLDIDWYYVNFLYDPSSCAPDPRFVPLIFDAALATDENIQTAVQSALSANGWIIGFNEPNLSWAANTTPHDGAVAWRRIEAAALPAGVRLAAPTPSQHNPCYFSCDDNLYGYTWIWEMVDEYEAIYGEKPHFDAFSWNVFMADPQDIKTFVLERRQEAVSRGYWSEFWIVSYAGECWNSDIAYTGNEAIMDQVTPWLISTPWITRYVWFTNRIRGSDPWAPNHQSCTLINPVTGELTGLGKAYRLY